MAREQVRERPQWLDMYLRLRQTKSERTRVAAESTANQLELTCNTQRALDVYGFMHFDKPANVFDDANMVLTNPPAAGVWRRVGRGFNSHWELYPFDVQETIISAFFNGRSSAVWIESDVTGIMKRFRGMETIQVATHRADFAAMKEIEIFTGVRTDLSIVHGAISIINYTPTDDPLEAGVWCKRESEMWHCYEEQTTHQILKAWRRREQSVTITKDVSDTTGGVQLVINLTDMLETSPSGDPRPIQIIPYQGFRPESQAFQIRRHLSESSWYLWGEALRRLVSLEFIHSIVDRMVLAPHEIQAIEPSKHINDYTMRLYWNFRHRCEAIIRQVPGCRDQLRRILERSLPDSPLSHAAPIFRHVLYLARWSEADDILEEGLQLNQHTKEENFALTTSYYDQSHNYRNWKSSTYSVLIFLVVDAKGSKRSAGNPNAIPVTSTDHRLPIAQLRLKIPKRQLRRDNSFDSTGRNGDCDIVMLGDENTRTGDALSIERPLLPSPSPSVSRSRSEEDMSDDIFLNFKLYCTQSRTLRFVAGSPVQIKDRPRQILRWLRQVAGFQEDAEILLYKMDFETSIPRYINLDATYEENQLRDRDVITFSKIMTATEIIDSLGLSMSRQVMDRLDLPISRSHNV